MTEGVKRVLLPFQTKGQLPEDVTVEWRCSDPKPRTVHVYQNGQIQPQEQDEVYRDRTQMKTDPMRSGDLSLSLSHPHFNDGGVYICTIKKDGGILTQKIVVLCIQGESKSGTRSRLGINVLDSYGIPVLEPDPICGGSVMSWTCISACGPEQLVLNLV